MLRISFGVCKKPFLQSVFCLFITFKTIAYTVKTASSGALSLKDYIEERAVEVAHYIIENKATVRQAAKKFGISKSTVHKDCAERLRTINPSLAAEVRKILDVNKQERHIRGGLATKEKYLHMVR